MKIENKLKRYEEKLKNADNTIDKAYFLKKIKEIKEDQKNENRNKNNKNI